MEYVRSHLRRRREQVMESCQEQAKDMKKQAGAEAVIAAATARADKAEKSADESRRLAAAEAEEIKNLKAETAKKATEQQQAKATPAAKVDLAMEDIPVVNLTWAVDRAAAGQGDT